MSPYFLPQIQQFVGEFLQKGSMEATIHSIYISYI